jgi:hypothetical protein
MLDPMTEAEASRRLTKESWLSSGGFFAASGDEWRIEHQLPDTRFSVHEHRPQLPVFLAVVQEHHSTPYDPRYGTRA